MSFTKKKIRVDLSIARTNRGEQETVQGRALIVTAASSATANCDIAMLGDFTADPVNFDQTAKVTIQQGFEGFYITNTAQPGQWIELSVTDGSGDFDYTKSFSNSISAIAAPVMETGGQTASSAAVSVGAAQTLLVAADANGTGWIVQNLGSVDLYIGVTGVTIATGIKIGPGQMISWDCRAALYGIVAAGTCDTRVFKSGV